jgi:hypothetical protein
MRARYVCVCAQFSIRSTPYAKDDGKRLVLIMGEKYTPQRREARARFDVALPDAIPHARIQVPHG